MQGSKLIYVSLVGPSLDYFNDLPYVKKWLTRGNRAACDNQSRKANHISRNVATITFVKYLID